MRLHQEATQADEAELTGEPDTRVSVSTTSLVPGEPRRSTSSAVNVDDPVIAPPVTRKTSLQSNDAPSVIIPTISIRPETATMNIQKGTIAAMISIQVPSAGQRLRYPKPNVRVRTARSDTSTSPGLPPSPILSTTSGDPMLHLPATLGGNLPIDMIEADLRRRLQDFPKSAIAECGPLRMYDQLDVRKPNERRTFLIYLFSDAVACISEEGPSGFTKMFKAGGTLRSKSKSFTAESDKKTLKLRGRIHFKHVRKIVDSSTHTELCLTLTMIDEKQPSFTLGFKNRSQYDLWWKWLNQVFKEWRDKGVGSTGGNSASKVAKLMGPEAPMALRRSPAGAVGPTVPSLGLGLGSPFGDSSSNSISSITYPADSIENIPQPLAPMHTPIDLVIVLALPQAASTPSTPLPLKTRLIRQSLQFIMTALGPYDRLALVSCEHGTNIRRTPLLCPTAPLSRRRLEHFTENIGAGQIEDDEFEYDLDGGDEQADLVTSINVSLDTLMNRSTKNPLSSLLILSDTAEMARAGQIEMVQARLESLNIPIHTVGYGKSHDPSPLLTLSHYSQGTYTFVREWYHLRDTLAGIIGGMLSIAITKARISLSCADHDFRIARDLNNKDQVAAIGAKTVDLEMHDLRFGETREFVLEFTYDPDGLGVLPARPSTRMSRMSTAISLDRVSQAESSSVIREMVLDGRMIDEVPVVEVDCSYHDPATARTVSHLSNPLLLTIPLISAPMKDDDSQTRDHRILPYDPVVKRRRMEIVAADMTGRALAAMLRSPGKTGASAAEKILISTRNIYVQTINTITDSLPKDRAPHSRKEILAHQSVGMLQTSLQELESLTELLWEHPQVFERDHRNVATQHVSLRSWQ